MLACAEPLFVDPYAGCFVAPNVEMAMKKYSHHYCLATKFIDDKLLRTVNHIDGLKQVVTNVKIGWMLTSDHYEIESTSALYYSAGCSVDRWHGHSALQA